MDKKAAALWLVSLQYNYWNQYSLFHERKLRNSISHILDATTPILFNSHSYPRARR